MKVILDSSFIISCAKEKIDFLTQLEEQGFEVIIPREVLQELKDLKNGNKLSQNSRESLVFALKMIENKKLKKISCGQGRVDDLLIDKGNEGYYVATLDREIKRSVPRKIVIFRAEKRVGVE